MQPQVDERTVLMVEYRAKEPNKQIQTSLSDHTISHNLNHIELHVRKPRELHFWQKTPHYTPVDSNLYRSIYNKGFNKSICLFSSSLSTESHSPTTVSQRDGDGTEQQIAFGLTDDGFTVCSWGDDHKLSQAVPVMKKTISSEHSQENPQNVYSSQHVTMSNWNYT